MSFSTVFLVAAVASVATANANPEWTNTWWTPSSVLATASASSSQPAWVPSSSAVPTSSGKVDISTSTSYTNTVYVTKPTTATTTVDCGKGTMIYGNGSAPAFTPTAGPSSAFPTDLPSDWTKSIPASILPPQMSGSGGIVTTNCANASLTYTFTYTPSGSKPKKTSSSAETKPTKPSHPSGPSGGDSGSSSSGSDSDSSSGSDDSKPSHGFSAGDSSSAAPKQDIAATATLLTFSVMALAAFML